MLATGVNGHQIEQIFKVIYADGTSDPFKQSLSDWFMPQNFPHELSAVLMPHRNSSCGAVDNRQFSLYKYTFVLDSGKTIAAGTPAEIRSHAGVRRAYLGSSTLQ